MTLLLKRGSQWTSKTTCGKVKNPTCFAPDAVPDRSITGTPFDTSIAPESVCRSPRSSVKRARPDADCIVPSNVMPDLTVSETS